MKYKLSPKAKERCLARIGEVEEKLREPTQPYGGMMQGRTFTPPTAQAQAPSMQKAIQEMMMVPPNNHEITVGDTVLTAPPRAVVPVEVSTGKGTRGPRKF
jgi:hypothetical protein